MSGKKGKKDDDDEEEEEEEEEDEEEEIKEVKKNTEKKDDDEEDEEDEEAEKKEIKKEETKEDDEEDNEVEDKKDKGDKEKPTPVNENKKLEPKSKLNDENQNNNTKQITPFSKIALEMFDKHLGAKGKTRAHNDFNDPILIEKINDENFLKKLRAENNLKSPSPTKKTKDAYFEKSKQYQLEKKEMIELLKKEEESKLNSTIKNPNDKKLKKSEIRSWDDFYNEQNLYSTNKKKNIEQKARENLEKLKKKDLLEKPIISEASKKLATEKRDKNEKIHEKLFKSKLNHQKKTVYKERKQKKKGELTTFEKKQKEKVKKSQAEIDQFLSKLYEDGVIWKKKKEESHATEAYNSMIQNIAKTSADDEVNSHIVHDNHVLISKLNTTFKQHLEMILSQRKVREEKNIKDIELNEIYHEEATTERENFSEAESEKKDKSGFVSNEKNIKEKDNDKEKEKKIDEKQHIKVMSVDSTKPIKLKLKTNNNLIFNPTSKNDEQNKLVNFINFNEFYNLLYMMGFTRYSINDQAARRCLNLVSKDSKKHNESTSPSTSTLNISKLNIPSNTSNTNLLNFLNKESALLNSIKKDNKEKQIRILKQLLEEEKNLVEKAFQTCLKSTSNKNAMLVEKIDLENTLLININVYFIFISGLFGYYRGVPIESIISEEEFYKKPKFFNKKDEEKPKEATAGYMKCNKRVPELDGIISSEDFFFEDAAIKTHRILFNHFKDNRISSEAVKIQEKEEELEKNSKIEEDNKKNKNMIERIKKRVDNEKFLLKSESKDNSLKDNEEREKEEKKSKPKKKKNDNFINDYYKIKQKKKEMKIEEHKKMLEKDEVKECTFQPNITTKKALPKFTNVNKLFEVADKTNDSISIREKWKNKMANEKDQKENEQKLQCTFKPQINKIEKALFCETHIIEQPLVKKEFQRLQEARFKRKLLEYQIEKGLSHANTKKITSLEEIQKEEELAPIVFHLEKNHFKDTFDNSLFKGKKSPPKKTEKEKKVVNQDKIPIVSFDFNVSRTKVEKIEIFADDDPYLFAQEFSTKYSKFFMF